MAAPRHLPLRLELGTSQLLLFRHQQRRAHLWQTDLAHQQRRKNVERNKNRFDSKGQLPDTDSVFTSKTGEAFIDDAETKTSRLLQTSDGGATWTKIFTNN